MMIFGVYLLIRRRAVLRGFFRLLAVIVRLLANGGYYIIFPAKVQRLSNKLVKKN